MSTAGGILAILITHIALVAHEPRNLALCVHCTLSILWQRGMISGSRGGTSARCTH